MKLVEIHEDAKSLLVDTLSPESKTVLLLELLNNPELELNDLREHHELCVEISNSDLPVTIASNKDLALLASCII